MLNCLVPESPCWYSHQHNPARKLKFGLEYITDAHGNLACINTQRANQVVGEALRNGLISELASSRDRLAVRPEARLDGGASRLDFLLGEGTAQACYIEVKSVTLVDDQGIGSFPDAPTERGRKHLRDLIALRQKGFRAVLLLVAMNRGIRCFRPAAEIDAAYAELLELALEAGVEVLIYRVGFDADGMWIEDSLTFEHRRQPAS